ncbi:MAG: helix-turn-helix domain-containing protein [Acidimicrobiia bacterium]
MTSRAMEHLLTLEETAEYLRLTPGALYTQRYRREKPGVLGIRVGRRVLFRPSDIDRFLDERLSEVEVDEDR